MRTSTTHPLQIAEIQPHSNAGLIGITFCPGKVQQGAMSGSWHRDLGLDLDAVAAWNAASVVTLVEDHELQTLQVTAMGAEVQARNMRWHHLPIPDVSTPSSHFEWYENQANHAFIAKFAHLLSVEEREMYFSDA